jgi:hypothetical protein
MSEHLDNIFSNWKNCEGYCEGCPHRGNGGGKKPFYGVGSLSGEFPTVAFVARDPGPGGEPDIEEIAEREGLELSEDQRERLDEHIERKYSSDYSEYRDLDIMKTGMCNGEYTETGRAHSTQMRKCALEFINSSRVDFNLYFTNLKKCHEFDEKETGTKHAITHCKSYLERELKELAPNIIIPFGNEATNEVYNLYLTDKHKELNEIHSGIIDCHPSEAKNITSEALKIREVNNETAIIPSIHFSNFGLNLKSNLHAKDHIPDDLSSQEYWSLLVEMSVEFLESE